MLITSRELLEAIGQLEASVTDLGVNLSQVAAGSGRHFRRQITAALQENPRAYRRRLRLELAANWLVATTCQTMDIAVACGFQSREGLARAFTAHFGIAPDEFRRRETQRLKSRLRRHNYTFAGPVKVADLPAQSFAYVRAYGGYRAILEAWRYLVRWRATTPGPTAMPWDFSYDTLGITPNARNRYDAALAIPGFLDPGPHIGVRNVPAGTYAILRVHGNPCEIERAWLWLIFRWLPASGYRIRQWFGLTSYHHPLPSNWPHAAWLARGLDVELRIPVERGAADRALLVSFSGLADSVTAAPGS
jgi:AraC family transcriptional regulator